MDPATFQQPTQSTAVAATFTGRSLDQQVDNDISPNNSNYSNLSNSSSSCSASASAGGDNSSSIEVCCVADGRADSSASSSSAPQYSEDIRRRDFLEAGESVTHAACSSNLLPRQGSGSSSTKTCEVDLGDAERDTFSPVSSSSNQCSPCGAEAIPQCNGDGDGSSVTSADNKAFEDTIQTPLTHKFNGMVGTLLSSLPSKEEKQRQNEEIVCMETSTFSSETGSWESVYPQANTSISSKTQHVNILPSITTDAENILLQRPPENPMSDKTALYDEQNITTAMRERTYSTGAAVSADTSSLLKGISSSSLLLRDFEKKPLSTSGTSACFIDASSLRDEDEVLSFPSLDGQHTIDDELAAHVTAKVNVGDGDGGPDSPTLELEDFHKSFARCKTSKTRSEEVPNEDQIPLQREYHSNSSASSNDSGANSPHKAVLDLTNNLSDEEKLWKRERRTLNDQLTQSEVDVDNLKGAHSQQQINSGAHEDATEASVSLAADADSSDSSVSVRLRREPAQSMHKQIPFSFQHNMQNFSIHPLGTSPKFASHHSSNSLPSTTIATVHAMHNDLSYTTDYSSSSPAPSLVWSEHEHRSNSGVSSGRQLHHHPQLQHLNVDESVKPSTQLPETPHNSIVHIEPVSSNTSSIHRDYTLSSSLSHHRDSGAYCSDATDSPIPMPRTPKRSKFDEANPIVSGGVSIEDFNIKQCESPSIKRRTDTCPIVSGGFVSLDFEHTRPINDEDDDNNGEMEEEEVELRIKPKTRKPMPGIASWVVDMSDCKQERRKSTSSTSSSLDTGPAKFRERSDSTSSHKSSCGFYISLDDMEKKPPQQSNLVKSQMSKSCASPKPSEFVANISQSEYRATEVVETTNSKAEENEITDKKNIFSMFIDFGDKKQGRSVGKKEPFNLAQRLSSSLSSAHKRTDDIMKSSASSTETLMAKSSNFKTLLDDENSPVCSGESKSLDYKCNLDPPITVAAVRRISQQRNQADATKRHSWGTNQSRESTPGVIGDYKRSISLTANGDTKEGGNTVSANGLMSIIDKLPIISKASSLSADSSLSPYDEYTGSKSGLSTNSNNSARNSMSGGERDIDDNNGHSEIQVARIKKRRRDVKINETFDKSSIASISDGLLSKDLSPASTTDTDDLTFQQDEEIALRDIALQQTMQMIGSCSSRSSAIIMETIIETKETASPKKTVALNNGHTMETLHATIEKQKMLLETVNENAEVEKTTFVKLSDMDKPVTKHDLNSPDSMSKSVGNHRQINRLFHDSRARPHSWSMTRSTGNSFLNITNSVDNIRSLSRLFPNFSKEFSNSLPNDIVLDHEMDYIQTDISADSSLASSFSRSGMDESSISCRQPRRLGEDLLKMFLQEIATDMIVEVHGRRIKAHKCILRSRCQYFAAMLAGHGAQSVVSLQGYSYSAVHFALCHIYSGASHPPDGISLMELAALADLLGLEGLKEVTSHALKTNYCHNFHKPCSGCIDGILQVLPVALNHALDDLYRKCLRWTCRHYLKVWPTRQFAQLPPDILGRCRQQIIAYLTSESVLDTVLDCDHLLGQLSAYRWGETCENLVRDILEAAYGYISDHFASLIASDSFLSLGHDRSRHIPRLESLLLRTAASLTADAACRSYQRITRLNTVLQSKVIQMPANLGELAKELQGLQEEDLDWHPEYIRLVSALLSAVEQCLIRQCSRAMRVTAWQRMDLDLRKKIQALARLTEPLDLKRNSKSVNKAFSFGGSTRNHDLIQVKLAIQAHSKRVSAQDTQLYKATQTQEASHGMVQTAERGVQANNDLREGGSKILKSNSRAHVPQVNNTTFHRRSQSEAPTVTHKNLQKSTNEVKASGIHPKANVVRLTDVRPRYLEPRKSRPGNGPIRSATSSSIPTGNCKGLHLSSSDSSRNSSPAARRNANGTVSKIGTKSTNMSMDSLASPARQRAKSAPRGKVSDSDANVDSLAESMKSSVITNKTISHESLTGGGTSNKLKCSNKLNNNVVKSIPSKTAILKSTQKANTNHLTTTTTVISNKSTRQLKQHRINSNSSSPSSVHTAKSTNSRLSSVSSTQSSRDLYKNRSISVPAADANQSSQQKTQRHSFLSAKSREILAKRAEKNKQQQNKQQVNSSGDELSTRQHQLHNVPTAGGPLRSASHSAVSSAATAMNLQQQQHSLRSSMPSNIPTRRPNSLQLKKTTNGFSQIKTNVATANAKNLKIATNNGNHPECIEVFKAAHAVKQKLNLLIDATMHEAAPILAERPTIRVESKLERSSTFSKDSAEMGLDVNELQIVE